MQQVGEVSIAAETFGVHPGMRLGEALARCAWLTLVPPDPAGVADVVGAAAGTAGVDRGGGRARAARPGLLRRARAAAPARRDAGDEDRGARKRARGGSARPARTGSLRGGAVALCRGRSRDAGAGAAAGDRPRRRKREAGDFLVALPVALLRARPALAELPEALERLGIATLGELAALSPAALADRFGTAGLHAHELASGGDGALRPRPASEFMPRVARAARGRVGHLSSSADSGC